MLKLNEMKPDLLQCNCTRIRKCPVRIYQGPNRWKQKESSILATLRSARSIRHSLWNPADIQAMWFHLQHRSAFLRSLSTERATNRSMSQFELRYRIGRIRIKSKANPPRRFWFPSNLLQSSPTLCGILVRCGCSRSGIASRVRVRGTESAEEVQCRKTCPLKEKTLHLRSCQYR